jgi:hypothetical protein
MKRIWKKMMLFALTAVLLLNVASPAFGRELRPDEPGDFDDGVNCEYCGEWRYDDWLCSGGNHCAAGYGCGDDHHCTECGACESWGDYCEECNLCLDCAKDNHQHCPECGACGQEVGGCNFCGCCFDCSPQCGAACEDLCLECHIELGLACCECGNCYVDGSVDYCPECMLCSDCMYADYCEECGMCGYCAWSINGNHCPDCMACTKEEGCLLCSRCFDCGGRCKDGCGEMCLECHLDEDAACPDCGNCFINDNHKRCSHCGNCEQCGDGFCENCNMCMRCCVETAAHCPICQICYEDAAYYCLSCGCCSECAMVCPGCHESCDQCGYFFCRDCGYCSNCKSICEVCERCEECTTLCASCQVRCADCAGMCANCQTCGECAAICPECGEACSACAVICPWCELCADCCGEISREAGCDHGVCVMDPDWDAHWAAEHAGELMVKLQADRSSALVGDPITWTATPVGAAGTAQYCFDVLWEDPEANQDDFVYEGSWTTAPTLTFTPSLPGEYSVWLSVKDEAGKTADVQGARVVVRYAENSLRVLSVAADKTNAARGQTITWTAAVQGGVGELQYRFDVYRDTVIVYSTDYGPSQQLSYLTENGGVYKAKVYVKDEAGTEASKLSEPVSVLEILSVVPEQTSVETGTYVPWTVTLVGETKARKLCYDLWKDGQLVAQGFYVASPTYGYVLSEPGVYTVKVSVQDVGGTLELMGEPVTVGLPVPILAGAYRNGKQLLSWNEISGVTTYYVYRRDYNGGEWGTWALKVKAAGTEWTDETAIPGRRYEYRMRAEWAGALGGYSNTLTMPNLNPFEDVGESDAFFTPVLWAYYHEPQVTAGTDTTHFSPERTVMRADAMVFFWAANNRPAFSSTDKTFKDVKKKHWAYAAVMWAVENGITGGTDAAGNYFSPQRTCSRSEILQFLYAAMGKPAYTINNPYSDVKPKHWFYEGAIWAYEKGLERGEDGNFHAKTPCTRAFVVTYLYRFFTGLDLDE